MARKEGPKMHSDNGQHAGGTQVVEAPVGTDEPGHVTRARVYKEIEGMFGLVPSMFKHVPDYTLELEWQLFKRVQFDPGPIPNKYRELIGVAVSAATKCR